MVEFSFRNASSECELTLIFSDCDVKTPRRPLMQSIHTAVCAAFLRGVTDQLQSSMCAPAAGADTASLIRAVLQASAWAKQTLQSALRAQFPEVAWSDAEFDLDDSARPKPLERTGFTIRLTAHTTLPKACRCGSPRSQSSTLASRLIPSSTILRKRKCSPPQPGKERDSMGSSSVRPARPILRAPLSAPPCRRPEDRKARPCRALCARSKESPGKYSLSE